MHALSYFFFNTKLPRFFKLLFLSCFCYIMYLISLRVNHSLFLILWCLNYIFISFCFPMLKGDRRIVGRFVSMMLLKIPELKTQLRNKDIFANNFFSAWFYIIMTSCLHWFFCVFCCLFLFWVYIHDLIVLFCKPRITCTCVWIDRVYIIHLKG